MNKNVSMRALCDWAERRRERMLHDLGELVEAESPSTNKAAVDRLGKLLAQRFGEIDGRVRVHPARDYGDHLQVDFEASQGKPILLLGHFDTVWDVGTLGRMPLRVEKDRLWGPGAYDMKAGIVMMMHALGALRELAGGLPRPVTVFLVTDEEVGSSSSRATTEALAKKSEAVLVLEPATGIEGALKTARKGVGEYQIRVTGVSAHAGLDFQKGHSAVLELARQLLRVAEFTDVKRGVTVSPGVIRGGTRTNVIPAEAAAEVDVRIAQQAQAAVLEKKFRSLKPFNGNCKVEISGGVNRPPLERTPQVAALFATAQRLAADVDWKLDESAVGGGSDGNFTAALGIPTLDGLGCAGDGAHAVHECIVVDELPRRTALIAGLLQAI